MATDLRAIQDSVPSNQLTIFSVVVLDPEPEYSSDSVIIASSAQKAAASALGGAFPG